MTNREFRLENEKQFDRTGPVRWIASHLAQYPWLPVAAILAAVVNNFAASYIQLLIGRGFDLLNAPGWTTRALGLMALTVQPRRRKRSVKTTSFSATIISRVFRPVVAFFAL